MSKKILSIALAVVMLFSVLACTVGAANTTVTTTFPQNADQVGFRVVTDAYVGQPAGEPVTVKVYWVHAVGTDYSSFLQSIGNVVLCYTDAFEYAYSGTSGYEGRTWGEAYAPYFKPASNVNANNATYINSVISKLSDADKAYGWTKAMLVQLLVDTSVTSAAKGFPLDPDCEIFSLEFTTTREVTADDIIGIPSHLVGSTVTASYSTGSKQVKWTAANIVNNEFAVPNVVANSDTATAKMRPGEAAGTVDLGITGTVNALSFAAGKTEVLNGKGEVAGYTAVNLANVGVQARVNGVVAAAESTCIYDTGDGFNYRAAITGIDAAGLGAQIEVRTYITDVNGNTYFSNWMLIDAVTVHDNAVGNGMTGIA